MIYKYIAWYEKIRNIDDRQIVFIQVLQINFEIYQLLN